MAPSAPRLVAEVQLGDMALVVVDEPPAMAQLIKEEPGEEVPLVLVLFQVEIKTEALHHLEAEVAFCLQDLLEPVLALLLLLKLVGDRCDLL